MEFHLFHVLSFLSLAFAASHATVAPEAYIKSVFRNSPMPKAIRDMLKYYETSSMNTDNVQIPDHKKYFEVEARDSGISTIFFLEKQMHQGEEVNMQVLEDTGVTTPFAPLEVKSGSTEDKLMKKAINDCWKYRIQSVGIEDSNCAVYLEPMVDFTIQKLGKNVKAISTEVNNTNGAMVTNKYKIEKITKVATDQAIVVCHKRNYDYVVFYCHMAPDVTSYKVSLVGADKKRTEAAAVCHEDTSTWSPEFEVFQVLKVQPGTPICHFLVEGDVAFVPSE